MVIASPKGFTLVELVLVIVVIGVLAGMTIVSYSGVQSKAYQAQAMSDANMVADRLEIIYADNRQYPLDVSGIGGIDTSPTTIIFYESNGTSYCLEAYSTEDPSATKFTARNDEVVKKGDCNGWVAE